MLCPSLKRSDHRRSRRRAIVTFNLKDILIIQVKLLLEPESLVSLELILINANWDMMYF